MIFDEIQLIIIVRTLLVLFCFTEQSALWHLRGYDSSQVDN